MLHERFWICGLPADRNFKRPYAVLDIRMNDSIMKQQAAENVI